jgi:hypothetical protein
MSNPVDAFVNSKGVLCSCRLGEGAAVFENEYVASSQINGAAWLPLQDNKYYVPHRPSSGGTLNSLS